MSPFRQSESKVLSTRLSAVILARVPPEGIKELELEAGRWVERSVENLLYVERGRLDAVVPLDDQGAQVIPVTFGAGEFALLSTLYSRQQTASMLVAAEPTRARSVPKRAIEAVLADDKELLIQLVRFLSERLAEVRARERAWLERSASGRVRAVLARVALDHLRDGVDPWRLVETHEHLALRCGISRSKVSIELKHLERAGAVKLCRGAIEILDYSALTSACQEA